MIKIHVGCGERVIPGWIHVDAEKLPHINHRDIWLSHLHDENSVDVIYASHFLEYFDRDEGLDLLEEWHKVLKPGGTIRIAVPDFDEILKARLKGYSLDNLLGPLYGKMNMNGKPIFHRTVFDFTGLKGLLGLAGFRDVRKYNWRDTEHAHIDDHSRAHLPHDEEAIRTGNFTDKHILISLNVEATK